MTHDSEKKDFAGKGVAGSALGLGIAGTALALLNNGGLNLFGGGNCAAPFRGGYPVGPMGPGAVGFAAHEAMEVGYMINNERRIGCLEAKFAGLDVAEAKNKEISLLQTQLAQANMLRYVDDKTCGMVKGQNLLNPNQIGDPYMGQRMVIATHPPVVEFDHHRSYGHHGYCNDGCRNDWERWY